MTRSKCPLNCIRPGLTPAVLLTAFAALAGAVGCGKAPEGVKDEAPTAPKGDPWKVAGQRLKKDTDTTSVRAALAGLVSDLNTQNREPLPAMPDSELAKLTELVPLTAEDREEVRSPTFTAYDAAYLADCFYLRDAARSLDLGTVPVKDRADTAFAWVCRQVYLRPWIRSERPDRAEGTALPPTAVLRRGSGSGIERMYVFLALLQQLEVDGCLIGPPDAAALPAAMPVFTADKKGLVTGAPRGPFWAVGVRDGADVRLYDPWRGAAFPEPVSTLARLRANPDAAKAWFEGENGSGATVEDAKKATAFLAVPPNALAPRLAVIETKLKGDLGVKLALGARALRDAFPEPKPTFWNPPEDGTSASAFVYGRAARLFLPVELGGTDRAATGRRLYDAYRREQLPPGVFQVPLRLGIPDRAAERLGGAAAGSLAVAFIELPNPRERIQRGQFQDAAKDLVGKQETFTTGLERLRLNRDADQQVSAWAATAADLYLALGRAEVEKNPAAEAAAQEQLNKHWAQFGAQYIVDRMSSEVGRAEATLLLALCKHEQAERSQARVDRPGTTDAERARLRPDAIDAWKTALAAWRTYEQFAAAHTGFPGRAAHAHALASRAEALAAQK